MKRRQRVKVISKADVDRILKKLRKELHENARYAFVDKSDLKRRKRRGRA